MIKKMKGFCIFTFLLISCLLCFNYSQAQDTLLKNIINFNNPIRSIAKDKDGIIYVQTLDGVFYLEGNKYKKSDFSIANFDRILSFNGKLSSRKFLEKNNKDIIASNVNCNWNYLLPNSTGTINFCLVEVDRFGEIWVSNGSKFLFNFKINNLFKRTIPNVSIRGIESFGNKLFVLSYSGFFINEKKSIVELFNSNSNIFQKDNYLFFASIDQVFRFDLKMDYVTILIDKNKTKKIGDISSVLFFDDKLYVGGFYGLFSMDLKGNLAKEKAIPNEVENIKIINGKLFVCTTEGIYHLENGVFIKQPKFPSGLVYNDIEERFGKFYAASSEGIWMSDENLPLAKNILKNTPYENYECFSIEWDDFYHLWFGTSKGLVKYNLNKNNFNVYLIDYEFNKRSSLKINSKFYFGTTVGLISFDSNNFSNEEAPFTSKVENYTQTNRWMIFLLMIFIFSTLISIYIVFKTKNRIRNNVTISNKNEFVGKQPPFTMENIELYILSNINTITAESLRKDSGMPKNQFYKTFSRFYDITPKQLIETIRREQLSRKKNF